MITPNALSKLASHMQDLTVVRAILRNDGRETDAVFCDRMQRRLAVIIVTEGRPGTAPYMMAEAVLLNGELDDEEEESGLELALS